MLDHKEAFALSEGFIQKYCFKYDYLENIKTAISEQVLGNSRFFCILVTVFNSEHPTLLPTLAKSFLNISSHFSLRENT